MKLKDIHTNLNPEINLLKFYKKNEISVDSFGIEKNIIIDLSKKLNKTIKINNDNKIKLNKLKNKNFLDIKKNFFFNKKIDLSESKTQNIELNSIKIKKMNKFFNFRKYLIFLKKFPKIIISIFIFLLLILLDKQAVEYFTNSGYEKLIKLQYSNNKKELLKNAEKNFVIANILFKPFLIFPTEKINDANNLILGGLEITRLAEELNNFKIGVEKLIKEKGEKNIMFSQLLYNNKKLFIYTENKLNKIKNIYEKIKFSDNEKLINKLNLFKLKLNEFIYYTYVLNNNFDTFLDILGHNKRKKYLIIFQNNDEIRPHGGFMGSMGILEVFRGQVKKFEKKDVYDYEFKIKKERFQRELAPKGLNKLTPTLGLRDSNYFINSDDSSNKIKFFINKAGYGNIDGIIYLNQNTILEILDLIGEFDSKVLNTKVNSSNFSVIMSSLVEAKKSKYGTLGTPKKILFDFMEEFRQILEKNKINNFKILNIILKDIKKREIQIYLFDKEKRILLEEFGLYNPIKYNETLDFSFPVFTSISGNKSDRYIKINYKKNIERFQKCSYKTVFEINLEHSFYNKQKKYLLNIFNKFGINKDIQKLLYIQGNGENRQYVRIIIPKNAIIKKSNNIGITPYYKRGQSIDFFLNTPVGKKSSFKIEYIIPNSECKIYNFKLYKQAGIKKYNLYLDKFGEKKEFKNINSDLEIN